MSTRCGRREAWSHQWSAVAAQALKSSFKIRTADTGRSAAHMTTVPLSTERPEAPLFCDGLGERVVAADGATGELLQILRIRPALTRRALLRVRAARARRPAGEFPSRLLRACPPHRSRPGAGARAGDRVRSRRRDAAVGHPAGRARAGAAARHQRRAVPDSSARARRRAAARERARGRSRPDRARAPGCHAARATGDRRARAWPLPSSSCSSAAIGCGRSSGSRCRRAPGVPRFDHRADVTGMGLVALALVLGRPLRADEFPPSAAAALNEARERTALGEEQPLSRAASRLAGAGAADRRPPRLCVGARSADRARRGRRRRFDVRRGAGGARDVPVALHRRGARAARGPVPAPAHVCGSPPHRGADAPSAPRPAAPRQRRPRGSVCGCVPPAVRPFDAAAPAVSRSCARRTRRAQRHRPPAASDPARRRMTPPTRVQTAPVRARASAAARPQRSPTSSSPPVQHPDAAAARAGSAPLRQAPRHRAVSDARLGTAPFTGHPLRPVGTGRSPTTKRRIHSPNAKISRRPLLAAAALRDRRRWRRLASRYYPQSRRARRWARSTCNRIPPACQVFVDGVERGQTPARLAASRRAHPRAARPRRAPRDSAEVTAGAEVSQYLEFAEHAGDRQPARPVAAGGRESAGGRIDAAWRR